MTAPRVELDDVHLENHHDIARHFAILGFQDLGLNAQIDDAYYMKFIVFDANLVGVVPVLRTFSAQDDLVLSQVLSHQFPPILGHSALLSPPGKRLAYNEEAIVIASFRQATEYLHSSKRPDAA